MQLMPRGHVIVDKISQLDLMTNSWIRLMTIVLYGAKQTNNILRYAKLLIQRIAAVRGC